MDWVALRSNGCHEVKVEDLCSEARHRLEEIKQDDIEALYSFRLSGPQRVWGILEGHVVKLLWWDPKHEVCPSPKQ